MRLLKVAIISLLLVGCSEETRKQMFPSPQVQAQGIRYVKDERTGLCFVDSTVDDGYHGMGTSHIYSSVPCTPEVEKLLSK